MITRPQWVVFGDSITQKGFSPGGWVSRLCDAYQRRIDVVNRGYSGYNTRLAKLVFPHTVAPVQHIELLTIFFGANDAALPDRTSWKQHVPVAEYKETLEEMIVRARDEVNVEHIVLMTPPPVSEPHRIQHALDTFGITLESSERENMYTKMYVEACKCVGEKLGVPVLDLWSIFTEHGDDWATALLNDGLHLTAQGNELVYNSLQSLIDKEFPGLTPENKPFDVPDYKSLAESDDPVDGLQSSLIRSSS